MDLDVGRSDTRARAEERAGLGHTRSDWTRLVEQVLDAMPGRLVPAILAVVADRCRLRRQVHVHVVWKFFPTLGGRVPTPSFAIRLQADAGQQQQAWRIHGPTRDDHLAARFDPRFLWLVLGQVPDTDRTTVLDDELRRLRVRLDHEVLAFARRTEIGGRRALTADVALRDVVEADARLIGAVEVMAERDADTLGGSDEPLRDRVVAHLLGDVQRSPVPWNSSQSRSLFSTCGYGRTPSYQPSLPRSRQSS